jgi:hypothetical protein
MKKINIFNALTLGSMIFGWYNRAVKDGEITPEEWQQLLDMVVVQLIDD